MARVKPDDGIDFGIAIDVLVFVAFECHEVCGIDKFSVINFFLGRWTWWCLYGQFIFYL